MTRVNAMSTMLKKPEAERARESMRVDQEAGRVISNKPKKDKAKTTNRTKKKRLRTALVERALRADAPKRTVTTSPSPT